MPETSSLPSVSPEPMSDGEWDKLLLRIEQKNVIPVIGSGLSVMQLGQPPIETELDTYLAHTLARQHGLADPLPDTLNDLACRCLQRGRCVIDDLYVEIFQALPNPQVLPLPLLKLAEIRGFSLFVSTTFDPYMAMALNEVRFGRRSSESTRVLAYEGNSSVDIPPRLAEIDHPVLYHLFGEAQASAGFAVTDEDVLEFMHTLQSTERQPKNLLDALHSGRLLILGCHFSGWLARFFLRLSSKDRLSQVSRADYLLEKGAPDYGDQVLFFEHFGGAKVLRGSATEFVNELHRRWKLRHPDLPPGPRLPAQTPVAEVSDVFLSYASEDVAIAAQLRERLAKEDISVWLDKENLRGGDKWELKIADALKQCTLFVPLISANAKIGRFRFVRTEWDVALSREKGMLRDTKYIVPVVADDTSNQDPSLPEGLRASQWYRRQDETDMARFVADLKQVVKKASPR